MSRFVLGFDLGGTKVSAAAFDPYNNILARAKAMTRAWRDEEKIFQTIVSTGRRALERAGTGGDKLCAVGIGSPGPLDPETGVIIESANLNFRNFPLGPRLAEEFGCPAIVDNDVNAGTYGELIAGAARGSRYALGVFWGTGIGGGVVIDGRLYHGFSKNAGEIGHIIIRAGGPLCGCGKRGCMEALASRTAMTRNIQQAIKRGRESALAKAVGAGNELIPSDLLKQAYDAGDQLAVSTVNRAAKYVGIGIGSLINVLSPEVIVLGGGVIEAFGQEMIERIDRTARKTAFDFAIKDVRMVRAELGDDAGMLGAALLARQSLQMK
jgi:glucokinase